MTGITFRGPRPSATKLAQTGVDLATLAAILGRSSIRIVQRYVHPTADPRKQAIRRFEEVLAAGEQPDGKRIP